MDKVVEHETAAMVWQGAGEDLDRQSRRSVLLKPGEALVEIELSTICGSDVHTVLGKREAAAPQILGHEILGRLIDSHGPVLAPGGEEITKGSRVTWSLAASCFSCDHCLAGFSQKCRTLFKYGHEQLRAGAELSGGFASHIILRKGTTIVPVPEEIPAAVLTPANCATATVAAAIARAEAIVGSLASRTVVVSGMGMLGLTAAAMLSVRGAKVVVSDISVDRLEQAKLFGGEWLFDSSGSGVVQRSTLAEVLTAEHLGEISAWFEMSGSASAVELAVEEIGIGGVSVLVGSVSPGAVSVQPERIVRSLGTVVGVHNYAPEHLVKALEFLERHWREFPFATLVREPFALTELSVSLEAARNPEPGITRVAVTPGLG